MNRSAAMKTLYLASAFGTLILLGCSAGDGSEDNDAPAGKAGSAGAKAPLGGLANAGAASIAGAAGRAGAAAGGAGAGGAAGAPTAGGATAAGASTAGAPAGVAGIPNGGDSFGFGFGGVSGLGSATTVIRGDVGSGGTSGVNFDTNRGGAGTDIPPHLGGFGGTGIWISF